MAYSLKNWMISSVELVDEMKNPGRVSPKAIDITLISIPKNVT